MAIRRVALLLVVLCGKFCGWTTAQVNTGSNASQEDALRVFIASYVESLGLRASEARYFDTFIDLNGDGVNEAIVYLAGRDWCGTGGCLTLVLARDGTSYRLVGHVLATRPPIRALRDRAHGWRTLTAWVSGGGIDQGYEAVLPYDGTRYPVSAAPPYAHSLSGVPKGEVVIPASAGALKNEKLLSPGHRSTP
jgi:hypothetical protein